MRRVVIFLLLVCLFNPQLRAQNDGAVVAGIAGGLLAIGTGIAAVEQMKEQAELTATQWVLSHCPELNSFSLKTLDFDGKKLKDMSSTSVITFKIQEFEAQDKPELTGKKQVLFGFTSFGWINQAGIDFDKVRWYLIDRAEWTKMMVAYTQVASGETDEAHVQDVLEHGKVVNRGVKHSEGEDISFYKLEGDMYLVTDYSADMKLVYNERSLGIFLKETRDLVQIGRGDIIMIHEFLMDLD